LFLVEKEEMRKSRKRKEKKGRKERKERKKRKKKKEKERKKKKKRVTLELVWRINKLSWISFCLETSNLPIASRKAKLSLRLGFWITSV